MADDRGAAGRHGRRSGAARQPLDACDGRRLRVRAPEILVAPGGGGIGDVEVRGRCVGPRRVAFGVLAARLPDAPAGRRRLLRPLAASLALLGTAPPAVLRRPRGLCGHDGPPVLGLEARGLPLDLVAVVEADADAARAQEHLGDDACSPRPPIPHPNTNGSGGRRRCRRQRSAVGLELEAAHVLERLLAVVEADLEPLRVSADADAEHLAGAPRSAVAHPHAGLHRHAVLACTVQQTRPIVALVIPGIPAALPARRLRKGRRQKPLAASCVDMSASKHFEGGRGR
mmetsp:Transcript_29314/g.83364  ORF Transcript_29314/g.83364 Transcript_29314/m.83364 type:complete len:286 (+) Transcript_29314:909-1766(+)